MLSVVNSGLAYYKMNVLGTDLPTGDRGPVILDTGKESYHVLSIYQHKKP